MMSGNNRAVIYCRTASGTDDSVARSLAAQEARCNLFAAAEGYEVIATYTDHASGYDPARKGLASVLAALKASPGTSVLMDGPQVLAREPFLYGQLAWQITAYGGRIVDRQTREAAIGSLAQIIAPRPGEAP